MCSCFICPDPRIANYSFFCASTLPSFFFWAYLAANLDAAHRGFINSMGLSQKPSNALGACQWIIDSADKEEKKRKRMEEREKRSVNQTVPSWAELKWATTFNAIARKIDDNSSVDNFTCHQWQWHKNANNFQLKQFPTIFQRLVEEQQASTSSYGSSLHWEGGSEEESVSWSLRWLNELFEPFDVN